MRRLAALCPEEIITGDIIGIELADAEPPAAPVAGAVAHQGFVRPVVMRFNGVRLEPFAQAEVGITREFGGTGLGLALTALPAMAESQYGSGTGTITAQAKVNLSVTVPKLILLRVGSTNTTVDTVTWTSTLSIPGVPTTPLASVNNTNVDWNGAAPTVATASAAATLTMMVLPLMIVATREALKAVPSSLREGSYALGATRWQTVYRQVLPAARPGIATGSILGVSRALGESAPLILLGALAYVSYNPTGFDSDFTVLPLMIFKWATEVQDEYRGLAAAAIVVLLLLLFALNAVAIIIRDRSRIKW